MKTGASAPVFLLIETGKTALGQLTSGAFFHAKRVRAAGRTSRAATKGLDIELEFSNGATESIAMHSELAGSLALISFVLLQDGEYEFLFEFANCFAVKNAALAHLHDQSFQLIFHKASLMNPFRM